MKQISLWQNAQRLGPSTLTSTKRHGDIWRNLKKLKNNRAVKRKVVADEKQTGKGRAFCSAPGKTRMSTLVDQIVDTWSLSIPSSHGSAGSRRLVVRRLEAGDVQLRALAGNCPASKNVMHAFGNVRGMITDAFDILRTKQQMHSHADVSGIFHHIG